jgi:hypothetical protein
VNGRAKSLSERRLRQPWHKDTVINYLPPTTAPPSTTLAHRDYHGWSTTTTQRLLHPCMLSSVCQIVLLRGCVKTFCENCVRARGASSACGARSFQRDTRRCACSPAARAGWPPVARAQKRCCMLPSTILPKEGSPKIDGGGDRGLVFLLFFVFVFDISLSDRGQQRRSSREGGARHWRQRWEAEVVRRGDLLCLYLDSV